MAILASAHSISGLSSDEIDQYLFLLRDLCWRTIEGVEDHAGLKKRLMQLLRTGYPSELQLPQAYLVLLSHLLKLEPLSLAPRQMPNGATCLDSGGLCAAGSVPEPTQLAELGALWLILGARLNNEALIYAGLKAALWQTYTLDHQGLPHFSLWSRATSFRPSHLAAYNYLLFSLAYRLTAEQGYYQAAQIQKIHGWDSSSLAAKLLNLVPEKRPQPIKFPHRPFAEEMTVGLLKFMTPEWSMACSVSGWNSGLLSYHKNNVAIVNAAPQTAPFDTLEGFGIERACSITAPKFYDTIWEKTPYNFHFRGWTKAFALSTWLQMDAYFEAQKLTLSCQLQQGRLRDELAMVFYARCDQIAIGGKTTLQAGALQRYQEKSMPLELRSGNETIFLEPEGDQEMQIIPLAGGDHFWGAQFLIAFSLDSDKDIFQYTIK